MHPATARTNRSTLQATIPPAAASPLLTQHQQQVLYSPIASPVVHYQPCATSLHPACVYPGVQHTSAVLNPTPTHIQGKNARWPPKTKVARNQQQQQPIQQQLYTPKPVVLYDQSVNNAPATPQPTASFLVASSTFAHGSFPNDQYSASGVGLIPQAYYKPQDVQAFCLQNPQQQQLPQEPPIHGSYYNLAAANACSLQTVNANSGFQLSNLGSYTGIATHQIPGAVQTQPGQIFGTSPVNLTYSGGQQKEKPSVHDVSSFKYAKSKMPTMNIAQNTSMRQENYNEWTVPTTSTSTSTIYNAKAVGSIVTEVSEPLLQKATSCTSTKTQEEHYSDESSASFDFTIEAEKMVSALCTSSNDFEKEDARNKKSAEPLFSGAGDTASNKPDWFADFCCTDYGNGRSIAVQTENLSKDRAQYPELIRKMAYWGCSEAEIVLGNSLKTDPKSPWLKQLSSATKTAMTKSSTSFPIFAGDRVFVSDLITALLRITNGWLILDNYFNKQHYPSLSEKFDSDLLQHFQAWEENTYEVLNQVVQTFKKLDENSESWPQEEKATDPSGFPGKSLCTNLDLFDPLIYANTLASQDSVKTNASDSGQFTSQQLFASNYRNIRGYETDQKPVPTSSKEAKLRSKWTVTENPTTTSDSPKSVPNMFLGLDESGGQSSSRFRTKGSASTLKLDSSTRSLNAEFFHLRSKVLETSHDLPRPWTFKEKKSENNSLEKKIPESESPFKQQRFIQGSCENPYGQKYFPRIEGAYVNPSPVSLESVYFASTADAATTMGHNYALCYTAPYAMTDYSVKYYKNVEQTYENRAAVADPAYIAKSPIKQLELASVPRNKMTLLSQIEPYTQDKASEEMTANLSAWFASMKSTDGIDQVPNVVETKPAETIVPRLPPRQELSKNALELARQLQMDTNRQLQTLQNMQSIQSAPWTALNLINNCNQVQQHPNDDYDSSEDVRVYMKPGSYNVPKKKHQRKSNRRVDNSVSRNQVASHRNHYVNKEKTYGLNSSTPVPRTTNLGTNASTSTSMIKVPFPATPILPPPTFSLENSPRILKRSDACASKEAQDVTWKAACASAEILLDALNVKADAANKEEGTDRANAEDDGNHSSKSPAKDARIDSEGRAKFGEKLPESLKRSNECDGASSYEASGDDSESPYRLSPNTSLADISQSPENRNGIGKTNVKTDSWLIRTLNSVSIISKQKRRKKNNDQSSSESTNSSAMEDEDDQTTSITSLITTDTSKLISKGPENTEESKCSREGLRVPSLKNDLSLTEEVDRIVGKATYSETVRRSLPSGASHPMKKEAGKKSKLNSTATSSICSTVIPIPGRKSQRKDTERSFYLLQKSRKSYAKKPGKSGGESTILGQSEEGSKMRISRCDTAKGSQVSTLPFGATTKPTARAKSQAKKKESGYSESPDGRWPGKSSDRGWSVWYSSKRKQTLSPLALSKLEIIHQTVWKMEGAQIFKHPSGSIDPDKESATGNTEARRISGRAHRRLELE